MNPDDPQGLRHGGVRFIDETGVEGGAAEAGKRARGGIDVAVFIEFVYGSAINRAGFSETVQLRQRAGKLETQFGLDAAVGQPGREGQTFPRNLHGRSGITHLQVKAGEVVQGSGKDLKFAGIACGLSRFQKIA